MLSPEPHVDDAVHLLNGFQPNSRVFDNCLLWQQEWQSAPSLVHRAGFVHACHSLMLLDRKDCFSQFSSDVQRGQQISALVSFQLVQQRGYVKPMSL